MALIKCSECGKDISDKAVSCPNCGAKNKNNSEGASTGLKVICFLIPLIGIIIFAINISTRPKYAKGCLIASILPTIIFVVVILSAVVRIRVNTTMAVPSSSYDDNLSYCEYTGCYNEVSDSWNDYCDKHSYMEY